MVAAHVAARWWVVSAPTGREREAGRAVGDPFAKDCQCVTHDGPHWLHMDRHDKQRADDLLRWARENPPTDFTAAGHRHALFEHVATMELARLDAKEREMRRRGIAGIPPGVDAMARESHERWVAANRERIRGDLERDLTDLAREWEHARPERREEIQRETAEAQGRLRRLS
jgi:hypothetical protein